MTRYFIYRTDGKHFTGHVVGPQWRKNPNYGAYAVWEDASEARRVVAKLGEQGHDCDIEAVEVE